VPLEVVNWSLALIPVMAMLALFVWLDVFKLMTVMEMLGLLALGALAAAAAYPVSGVFLDRLPLGYSVYSRFAAPWVEEAIKGLVIVGLFRFNRIGFKLDAVLSGFAVGAGFSVIENMIYLTRFPDLAPSVWMVRGLGTAVMHGTTVAILAAIAHELAERETREAAGEYDFNPLWCVPGYLVAGLIHMAFNQFPDQPLMAMIATLAVAPFLIMAMFKFGAQEAQKWLSQDRTAHEAQLAVWRSGGLPDDESGRRIGALIDRSDAVTGQAIRGYCEQMTALVLEAEIALHEQAGDSDRVRIDAREAFRSVEELRKAMGRSTYSALKPLLSFSKNDYWELSELRERLKR
jgi:RsiW-degrading membrane proteinase PrsW (M82 family)